MVFKFIRKGRRKINGDIPPVNHGITPGPGGKTNPVQIRLQLINHSWSVLGLNQQYNLYIEIYDIEIVFFFF